MALTKVTGQVINDTTGLVVGVTTVGGGLSATDGFFSGIITAMGNVTVGGTLTYEDVTNVDSVGIITARSDILVGSGITLSPDGDIFATGIVTATTFSGAFTGDGSALTGVANTNVVLTDKLHVGDSPELIAVGIGSDLEIFHDGTNSHIKDDTSSTLVITNDDLRLKSSGDEMYVRCVANGSVSLWYDQSSHGTAKLATSATGVTVDGTLAATAVTGDGSGLTGIAVGIGTESSTISGITTYIDLDKDDHEITASGICMLSVKGGTQGDSHTVRITNSGITTVNFDSYFKFPGGAEPALPTADASISLISFTVHKAGAVGVNTVLLAGASVSFS